MLYSERMRLKADELKQRGHAVILAVESSCDETAVAIVRDGRELLSNEIATQIDIHALYGGVVPEIASRSHVEALDPLCDKAFEDAGITADGIDAVAVTCGPGLVGALLTGVSWAKAYAWMLDKPLIGVNHIEGHVSANYIASPDLEPPFLCLVASGGHSHIVYVDGYGSYSLIGQTTDDAAGEAFDKAARALKIPYPGGPLLDKLAETGNDRAYTFPKPHTAGKYDLSFSGLKTAVVNLTHTLEQQGKSYVPEDFAASFRKAVVDCLVEKTMLAARDTGAHTVALAGGVAANRLLRREMEREASLMGLKFYMPPVTLCTDNAAMIGSAAYYRLMKGELAQLDLNAQPSLRLLMKEERDV